VAVQHLRLPSLQTLFYTTLFSLPPIILIRLMATSSPKNLLSALQDIFRTKKQDLKIRKCSDKSTCLRAEKTRLGCGSCSCIREIIAQKSVIALLALCLLLNNYFYFAAFNRTSIAVAVFTHYTAPLFVALLAPFFLQERFDTRTIPPLILALAGLATILFPSGQLTLARPDLVGALCGTASGLAYAGTLITAKHLVARLDSVALILGQNLFILLFLAPFEFLSRPVPIPGSAWLLLLLLGVVLCTLAPLFYLSGLKHLKAQHTAVIGYLEPLAAVLLGLLLTGSSPDLTVWLGGGAILIAGISITLLKDKTL